MADLPRMIKWYQDNELMKYYDELPVRSPFEVEELMRRYISAQNRLDFIIETKKKETVGTIYFSNINWYDRHLEIHTMVGEKNKRNMYFGAEAAFLMTIHAFHQLGMHKIYSRLLPFAKEAGALQKELGFRKEAVLKNRYYQDGEYYDAWLYGLLDREFESFIKSEKGVKYMRASQGGYK